MLYNILTFKEKECEAYKRAFNSSKQKIKNSILNYQQLCISEVREIEGKTKRVEQASRKLQRLQNSLNSKVTTFIDKKIVNHNNRNIDEDVDASTIENSHLRSQLLKAKQTSQTQNQERSLNSINEERKNIDKGIIEELRSDLRKLSSELEIQKLQLSMSNDKVQTLETSKKMIEDSYQKRMSEKDKEFEVMASTLEKDMQFKLSNYQDTYEKSKQFMKRELDNSVSLLNEQIESSIVEIKELKNKLKLEQENLKLKNLSEEQTNQSEIEKLIDQYQQQINDLSNQIKNTNRELKSSKDENNRQNAEIAAIKDSTRKKLTNLNSQIKQIKTEHDNQSQSYKEQIIELEQLNDQLNQGQSSSQDVSNQLQQKTSKLQRDLNASNNEINLLNSQIATLTQELESKDEEINDLENNKALSTQEVSNRNKEKIKKLEEKYGQKLIQQDQQNNQNIENIEQKYNEKLLENKALYEIEISTIKKTLEKKLEEEKEASEINEQNELDAQRKIDFLTSKINDLKEKNVKMEGQIEDLQETVEDSKIELVQSYEDIQSNEDSIQKLNQKNTQLITKLTITENNNSQMKMEISDAESQNESLKEQILALKEKIKTLKAEKKEMEHSLNELQKKEDRHLVIIKEKSEAIKLIEEKGSEAKKSSDLWANKIADNQEELLDQIDDLKNEIDDLNNQIAKNNNDAELDLNNKKDQIEDLMIDVQNLQDELDQTKKNLMHSENQLSYLKNKMASDNGDVEVGPNPLDAELLEVVNEFLKEFELDRVDHLDQSVLKNIFDCEKDHIYELEDEIDEMKNNFESLQAQLDKANKTIKDLKSNHSSLQKENDELNFNKKISQNPSQQKLSPSQSQVTSKLQFDNDKLQSSLLVKASELEQVQYALEEMEDVQRQKEMDLELSKENIKRLEIEIDLLKKDSQSNQKFFQEHLKSIFQNFIKASIYGKE